MVSNMLTALCLCCKIKPGGICVHVVPVYMWNDSHISLITLCLTYLVTLAMSLLHCDWCRDGEGETTSDKSRDDGSHNECPTLCNCESCATYVPLFVLYIARRGKEAPHQCSGAPAVWRTHETKQTAAYGSEKGMSPLVSSGVGWCRRILLTKCSASPQGNEAEDQDAHSAQ